MHQNGINESSNMLHYSNASSIEQNRRYLVIKGGACLVTLARRVVNSVVELGSPAVSGGLPERSNGGGTQ